MFVIVFHHFYFYFLSLSFLLICFVSLPLFFSLSYFLFRILVFFLPDFFVFIQHCVLHLYKTEMPPGAIDALTLEETIKYTWGREKSVRKNERENWERDCNHKKTGRRVKFKKHWTQNWARTRTSSDKKTFKHIFFPFFLSFFLSFPSFFFPFFFSLLLSGFSGL